MTPAEFVDLCKQLRALGATLVCHGEYTAKFVPVTATAVVQQPRTPDTRMLTPEQAREEERRRELGL